MRFVWAVVAFVLAAGLIGAGIAQRTVFLGPKEEVRQLKVDDTQAYTLIDGSVLNALPGAQKLQIQGDEVFGAMTRTADATAWLADVSYNHITMKGDKVVSQVVAPTTSAPELTDADTAGLKAASDAKLDAPSATTPVGSDLWLEEFTGTGTVDKTLRLPTDVSILVASDGTKPAPAHLSVAWRIDNSTPWAGPLIVLGGIALLCGVVLYVLGLRNMRRKRGPRRRGVPPLPQTEPIAVGEGNADKGVISRSTRKGGRRALMAVPLSLTAALALSGCTADAWPQFTAASPSPSATQTVVAPENQQSPVATEAQATEIINRVAATIAEADKNTNADLAGVRMTGAALTERETNYTLRGKISDYAALAAVPTGPFQMIVPQATDTWPRVIMAVWADPADDKTAPQVMMLQQDNPWAPYKLAFVAQLEAKAQVQDLAKPEFGALRVPPESTLVSIAPDHLAAAYADIIDNGDNSEFASSFDTKDDGLLAAIKSARDSRLAEFNKTGAETGSLTFSAAAGDATPIALATVKSGAIVAVTVNELDTVKPKSTDAVIRLTNNPSVKALTGVEESATGFQTTYADQIFFYVPAKDSGEPIRMLGFSSNLISSEVLK